MLIAKGHSQCPGNLDLNLHGHFQNPKHSVGYLRPYLKSQLAMARQPLTQWLRRLIETWKTFMTYSDSLEAICVAICCKGDESALASLRSKNLCNDAPSIHNSSTPGRR